MADGTGVRVAALGGGGGGGGTPERMRRAPRARSCDDAATRADVADAGTSVRRRGQVDCHHPRASLHGGVLEHLERREAASRREGCVLIRRPRNWWGYQERQEFSQHMEQLAPTAQL